MQEKIRINSKYKFRSRVKTCKQIMEQSVLVRSKVRWSKHIEDRFDKELAQLGITKELLEDIISKPDEVLFDSDNGRNVAVRIKSKLAVIYETRFEDKFIITAIYSSNLERVVLRRKRSGRWL